MTSLPPLAAPFCAFTLGCVLIHGARAHAAFLTRLLSCIVLVVGGLVLIAASMAWTPADQDRLDEITVYAAFADHLPEAE